MRSGAIHSFPTRRSSDLNGTNGDVVLWYKDLRASTVDEAMAQAQRAVAAVQPQPSPVYRIRLATGSVALQYALDHRSEEHTSELQSRGHLVCRLLLEKKK